MRAPVIGERWEARRLLALLTAFAVTAAMFVLFSGTARADHVSEVPQSAAANSADFWEDWGATNEGEDDWICEKIDVGSDDPYTLGDPPDGYVWRLLIVKKGSGDGSNELFWNPVSGQDYEHSGGGFSHLILCRRPADVDTTTTTVEETTSSSEATTTSTSQPTTTTSVEETTTTSVEETTSTSVEETTSTSVEETTSTSVEETTSTSVEETTTSSSIPADVLPTVVTTAPEVDPDDELPFTGLDTDVMIGLSILFLGFGAVLLTLTRKLEEN